MKTAYLSEDTIKQAFSFLKARKDHAHLTKNRNWEKEFENALRVIEELSARKR